MTRTVDTVALRRILAAFAAVLVALLVSMPFAVPAYAQNLNIDTVDVSDAGGDTPAQFAAAGRKMLLQEAYADFGTTGIYIDKLNYNAGSSIEQMTGALRKGDPSRGENANRILLDGGTAGHLKIRYPNSGRTSTGQPVDVVFDIDFRLNQAVPVPYDVFVPSTAGLESHVTEPYSENDEYRAWNATSGVSADTVVRVYVHNDNGTLTEATGLQFAFMFSDLDVPGLGGNYDDEYAEGVELIDKMKGPGYIGDTISQADGHLNTAGEPTEGGHVVVGTLHGNTWIHGNHDCYNMADSGVVLRADSGAHFIWRGHSCGTTVGITLADAIKPVTVKPMAVKAMLGGAPMKTGAFTFQLRQGSTVLDTATNKADGTVKFDTGVTIKMPGTYTYTIRETATSDNRYKLDTHVETVTVKTSADSGKLKVDSITYTPENGKFSNWAAPGKITIAKYDEDKGIRSTDKGHGNASLIGAEFTVYTDRACTQSTGKKIVIGNDLTGTVKGTDADSKESATKGLSPLMNPYYIKETKAPTGYELNKNVYKVESELL